MTLSGRYYNGKYYYRSKTVYHTKKAVIEACNEWKQDGFDAKYERSKEKFKNKYNYRIYTHDITGDQL